LGGADRFAAREHLLKATDVNKDQQLGAQKKVLRKQESTKINRNQQHRAESSIVIKNHQKSSPPLGAVIKNHQ